MTPEQQQRSRVSSTTKTCMFTIFGLLFLFLACYFNPRSLTGIAFSGAGFISTLFAIYYQEL